MKKHAILITLIICMCFGLVACGVKNSSDSDTLGADGSRIAHATADETEPVGASHIAVPIQVPHDYIYVNSEFIWQNYLYYVAYDNGENVVVRIDLDNPGDIVITLLGYSDMRIYPQLAIDDNGKLHVFIAVCELIDDNWKTTDNFWHQFCDGGTIVRTINITDAINASIVPKDFCIDKDGNAYIIVFSLKFYDIYNNPYVIFVLDPDGELMLETPAPPPIPEFFFKDASGIVNISPYYSNMLFQVNIETGNLDNNLDISGFPDSDRIIGLGVGTDGVLFYATETGAYDYDVKNDVLTERIKWLSSGLFIKKINHDGYHSQIYPLTDERYLWVVKPQGSSYTWQGSYRIIRPQTAEDIAAAEVLAKEWEILRASARVGDITIAVVGSINSSIRSAIRDFNSAHPYSRIELIQYGAETGDNHSEGLASLNMDIIAGRGPDMLLLPQDLSYGAYATMGIFYDLYPFLEADDSFDMADYRENIIRAYEIGGKLYGIPIEFTIDLLYGKADELDGRTGWNIDEFISFAGSFPGSLIFQHPTKTEVLDICLRANGGNLVDWASGDIGFDRELIKKILEFAGQFADQDELQREPGVYSKYMERISTGDIHLVRGGASASMQFYEELFRGPVTPVGYPSERGNGYLINSRSVITISSKCTYIDTAWQFISFLLSDEVQSRGEIYHPIRRENIENYLNHEREKTGTFGAGFGFSYDVRSATEAEIEAFLILLDTANEIRLFDQQIDNIIKEEAGSYFSGSKPLDSVVDVITDRIGIYVMEIK